MNAKVIGRRGGEEEGEATRNAYTGGAATKVVEESGWSVSRGWQRKGDIKPAHMMGIWLR